MIYTRVRSNREGEGEGGEEVCKGARKKGSRDLICTAFLLLCIEFNVLGQRCCFTFDAIGEAEG